MELPISYSETGTMFLSTTGEETGENGILQVIGITSRENLVISLLDLLALGVIGELFDSVVSFGISMEHLLDYIDINVPKDLQTFSRTKIWNVLFLLLVVPVFALGVTSIGEKALKLKFIDNTILIKKGG